MMRCPLLKPLIVFVTHHVPWTRRHRHCGSHCCPNQITYVRTWHNCDPYYRGSQWRPNQITYPRTWHNCVALNCQPHSCHPSRQYLQPHSYLEPTGSEPTGGGAEVWVSWRYPLPRALISARVRQNKSQVGSGGGGAGGSSSSP